MKVKAVKSYFPHAICLVFILEFTEKVFRCRLGVRLLRFTGFAQEFVISFPPSFPKALNWSAILKHPLFPPLRHRPAGSVNMKHIGGEGERWLAARRCLSQVAALLHRCPVARHCLDFQRLDSVLVIHSKLARNHSLRRPHSH